MAYLTNDEITANALERLEAFFGPAAHTDRSRDGLFGREPGKSNKGDTYRLRKPVLAEVNEQWAADYKEGDDDYVDLTMDKPKSVDRLIPDKDFHLDMSNFEDQHNQPAASALAHKWNLEVMRMYVHAWNYVGAPETVTSSMADFLQVTTLLDNNCAPIGDRSVFLNPRTMAAAVNANAALQHASGPLTEGFREGMYRKDVLGLDWHKTQLVANHTSGAHTGAGLIDGADQTGASLLIDSLTASSAAYKRGDILDLTGYRDVIFPTKEGVYGYARRVVVTSDVISDATGDETTVPIGPTLYAAGSWRQNVTGSIADAEAVLLFGHATNYASKTWPQCLAWSKKAIVLGFVELKSPGGMDESKHKTDSKRGITLRYTRRWDQDDSAWKVRYQTFGGLCAARPEWIVRICG
jgi:hypothetical protein